jgi:hypothetical protein
MVFREEQYPSAEPILGEDPETTLAEPSVKSLAGA